jgi:protein ImuB
VKPGLKRATALALAPDIVLGQADAARDRQALDAVVHAALAFTPSVTLEGGEAPGDAPHTVLLEVQASLRYFGGSARLLQRLHAALRPLGHAVHCGSAPTALGAAWLARWPEPPHGRHAADLPALNRLLDMLPVWLPGPAREHWEALQGMGLRTLSDLHGLPRSGLARRFGAPLLEAIDRARGRRPDPRDWLRLPESFDSRLELFARADTTAQVLHGASLLLARLVAWAGAQHAQIGRFTLHMQHEPRHRADAGRRTARSRSHWPSRRATSRTCWCCCASGWRSCSWPHRRSSCASPATTSCSARRRTASCSRPRRASARAWCA